jgi:hypothetical protein
VTRTLLLILAVLTAACTTTGSGRPAPARTTTAPSAAAPNTGGPWRASPPAGFEKVTITTQSTVTITSDTLTRTDTLHATLGASYSWTSGAVRKADGQLTDYRVAIGGMAAPSAPPGLKLPRPFSAVATTGTALHFTLPAESSVCTEPALSTVQGLHDAWVALPSQLVVGAEWTDTVTTLSCRDRVLLRGTSVRRFRVRRGEVDEAKRVVVIIERTARGRLTGDGDQFGEKISINGETAGTMQYAFDPVVGRFVRASGTSVLTFSLKSSRRSQAVKQSSAVSVVW